MNNKFKKVSSNYCLVILLEGKLKKQRKQVINKLISKNIGCSIYYPHPVPRMSYYKQKYGYNKNNFINASKFSDQSIALPIGPHINNVQINYIGRELKKIIKGFNE